MTFNLKYRLKKPKAKYMLDALFVFLNLSLSYSIVPYLLFRQYSRLYNYIFVIFLTIIYSLIRFRPIRFFSFNNNIPFTIYILLNVACFISAMMEGFSSIIMPFFYFSINFMFYLYLYNLFIDYRKFYSIKTSLLKITKGYLLLASLSVICSIILFSLIKAGFNPLQNQISLRYDLFEDNVNTLGCDYYFPRNIAILDVTSSIRIPFFQDYGIICGLYHEPHCQTFMTFPALFILLFCLKKKWQRILAIVSYLLLLLISGSTTNIISCAGCILCFILFTFKQSISKSIRTLIILLLVGLIIINYVDLSMFDFVNDKINSTGGSSDYSKELLLFAITPKSLFGTPFYTTEYVTSGMAAAKMDVGVICFILNIAFLLSCLYLLYKLFMRRDSFSLYLLLFGVYFFIHSTKIAMITYSLTMLTFVVFIINQAKTDYQSSARKES